MIPIPGSRLKRTIATHMFDLQPCHLCNHLANSTPFHLVCDCGATQVVRAIAWARMGTIEPDVHAERFFWLMAVPTVFRLHHTAGLCAEIGESLMLAVRG